VRVTTMFDRFCGVAVRVALSGLVLFAGAAPALAQDDPNPGAVTFTGSFDVLPNAPYIFRGILQESDPKVTLWPVGDIGLALFSGDGGIKSVGVNFGIWNSLHTGSSGLGGDIDKLHYEQDFYTTLSLGFGGGFTLGTTWTAYTSPSAAFRTVQELAFRVSKAHMLAPYGLVAFELGDEDSAAADGGNPGTYLELGVGPSWPIPGGRATIAIPVKVGMSLSDYYETPDGDATFGFFDVGALATIPLAGIPSRFGSWNFHAGVDVLFYGDRSEYFNAGDSTKVTGLFGIGLTY
jgi:hypothetical protein